MKTTRAQGRPPSAETLRRREFKARIPDYIKKRPGRREQRYEWKALQRSLANWEREQERQGITDDYRDLIAIEESGSALQPKFDEKYRIAVKIFEEKQARLKATAVRAGAQRAADRALIAAKWKEIALELMKKVLSNRAHMPNRSLAHWIFSHWPDDEKHKPALETLRHALPSLKLVASDCSKK